MGVDSEEFGPADCPDGLPDMEILDSKENVKPVGNGSLLHQNQANRTITVPPHACRTRTSLSTRPRRPPDSNSDVPLPNSDQLVRILSQIAERPAKRNPARPGPARTPRLPLSRRAHIRRLSDSCGDGDGNPGRGETSRVVILSRLTPHSQNTERKNPAFRACFNRRADYSRSGFAPKRGIP